MTQEKQIMALFNDLSAVLDRYSQEFDVSAAASVGVLQILMTELITEVLREDEDEE